MSGKLKSIAKKKLCLNIAIIFKVLINYAIGYWIKYKKILETKKRGVKKIHKKPLFRLLYNKDIWPRPAWRIIMIRKIAIVLIKSAKKNNIKSRKISWKPHFILHYIIYKGLKKKGNKSVRKVTQLYLKSYQVSEYSYIY